MAVSDEPKPPSSWTPEIVRDHLLAVIGVNDRRYEDKFAGQKEAVKDALAASEKAVNVAERNAEEWRKGANEWRGSMTDREGKFAMRSDLEAIKERLDRMEGGGKGQRDMWGWLAAGLAAVLGVAGYLSK